MYKHEEVAATVGELSPVLRGPVEELLRRGELFVHHGIPLDEALDSDLSSQLRLVLSDPELKEEFKAFWQALRDAAHEDGEAVMRGEHDHEL